MDLHELKQAKQRIWICNPALSYFHADWFEREFCDSSDSSGARVGGRQALQKFAVEKNSFVIRHYYRGGVPAYFTKDRFFFRGWHFTRAYREICLLQEMLGANLPVPQPVAARCIRHGISYSADIIMHEIQNTQSLAELLSKNSLPGNLWHKLGKTIHRFHSHGIQHVDLNAANILIDEGEKIYLIDFDRCVRRSYRPRWSQAGIRRLHRSLTKIKGKQEKFYFDQHDFQLLLDGYSE